MFYLHLRQLEYHMMQHLGIHLATILMLLRTIISWYFTIQSSTRILDIWPVWETRGHPLVNSDLPSFLWSWVSGGTGLHLIATAHHLKHIGQREVIQSEIPGPTKIKIAMQYSYQAMSFWHGSIVSLQSGPPAMIINSHIWIDLVKESHKDPNGVF